MMKVVITDDEIQIRKGLRMKVDWEEEGFEIVAEASNGKEALEILKKMDVDLIITDMRMPIMDGVELAKRCHQEFPRVKVIVLSGYSDFDYVKNSMKQGVRDYLLKPVAPDEIVETLRRIRQEVEEEKKSQIETDQMRLLVHSHLQEVQEQYLLQLVKGEWSQFNAVTERLRQLQLKELVNENVHVQFVTVEIREQDNRDQLKEFWLPFQMLCKEIAKEQTGAYSFHDPNYASMVQFLQIIDSKTPNLTADLVEKIQAYVKKYFKLETVIGIGSVIKGIPEFKTGYISSLLSWSQSQLSSESQVIDQTVTRKAAFDFSPNFEKRLTNAIENVDLQGFTRNLNTLLGGAEQQSVLSFSFVANRVLFLLGSLAKKYNTETQAIQSMIWNCQQSIWELNSQRKVMESLTQLSQFIIENVRNARFSNRKLIESIRHYLDEHYANEISLTTLSELFHINSAYLSPVIS